MKTLITTATDQIGQMTGTQAVKEIARMNSQTKKSWRMDCSDYMDVIDEMDDEINNPCKRKEGYVWVTCTPDSEENYLID